MIAATHSPTLVLTLEVMLAGALGAMARTFLNDAIAHRVSNDFPFGILTVNITGSFILGILTGSTWYHGLSVNVLTIAGIGLCGGFTTWSTAIWETLALIRLRQFTQASVYTLGGMALALSAAAAGIGLAAIA
jgi:CrcB protein